MVSIVIGSGAGLVNTSKELIGAGGELGNAATGRAGERLTVNAATGNLIVQGRDEYLVGVGPDVTLLRTYNSSGAWDGDNGDSWRIGYYRKVSGLTGVINNSGSTIKRTGADGNEATYTYQASVGRYISSDGAGQYDSLSYSGGAWSWTDGDTGVTERYEEGIGGSGDYLLRQVTDVSGHKVVVGRDTSGLITQLSTYRAGSVAADETITFSYTGTQLTRLSTSYLDSSGVSRTRSLTSYEYDPVSGKLTKVVTDLTPEDASVSDGKVYAVSYTYDANGRLQTLAQTDGSLVTVAYYADGLVKSITDQAGETLFTYDLPARKTTVKDALGQVTTLSYDSANRLLEISGAATGGSAIIQRYEYNAAGDLIASTNGRNETTTYEYTSANAPGALTKRKDATGNVLERTYTAGGLLESETSYSGPSVGNTGPTGPQTTRYFYDPASIDERQLAYVLGPQGQVVRYAYNAQGQLSGQTRYAGASFAGTASFAALEDWATRVHGSDVQREYTQYFYDFRGQLQEERRYAAAPEGAVSTKVRYGYDAFGRLLSQRNNDDFETTYAYDSLNRLTLVTDAAGATTTYSYDDQNRKTTLKLDNGQYTAQIFDTLGRLISSESFSASDAGLGATRYRYDALGRLRQVDDPTGKRVWMLYEASGRKVADIAANGQLTEYVYDAAGQLVQSIAYATLLDNVRLASLSDAGGNPTTVGLATLRPAADAARDRITTQYYDSTGRLVGVLDAEGYLTENQYNGTSALVGQTRYATAQAVSRLDTTASSVLTAIPSLTRPASDALRDRVQRNVYDGSGRLAASIDGEGVLARWTYDAAGHQLTQQRSAVVLNAAQRAADLSELQAIATAADDELRQFVYDNEGRLIAELDAEGMLTEYGYDAVGRLSTTSRYLSQVTRPVTLGGDGKYKLNVLTRADLDTLRPSLGTPLSTTRSYNKLGLLETETAADGTVTKYVYDRLQRLKTTTRALGTAEATTRQIDYDDWGRIKREIDGENGTVEYSYDAAGRRASIKDARGNYTYLYYDKLGRQIYAILKDPLLGGEVTETIYSNFNELAVTVRHSNRLAVADCAALSGGLADAALNGKISALNDTARDQRSETVFNRRGLIQQAIDALNFKTDLVYNAFGEVQSRTSDVDTGRRLASSLSYDRRGLLVQATQSAVGGTALSVTTKSSYDSFGRLLTSTDARNQSTAYEYLRNTGAGRKVRITDPAGTTTSTYDAIDRIVAREDRNGNTVTYTHDAVNRKLTVKTAENIQTVTEYTRLGQIWKVTDDTLATTTYAYDHNGNLLSVTDPLGNVTQYHYDANGNRDQITQGLKANTGAAPSNDGSALTTNYSFDAANRVLTQTVDAAGLNLQTKFEYDGQGRQLKITDARGTVTTQSFNAKGELTEVVIDPASLALKTSFRYDAQGRTLEVIGGAGSSVAKTTRYEYDVLGRRTAEVVDPAGLNLRTSYEYDANGNLIALRDKLGQVLQRSLYDGAGRLEVEIDGTGAVTRYRYDGEGHLTARLALSTGLGASFATDSEAVLASSVAALVNGDEHVSAFLYDKDGRLTHAINAAGEVTRSVYDALGHVIETIRYANRLPAGAPNAATNIAVQLAALTVDPAKDQHSYTRYDKAGRVQFQVDATGAVAQFEMDRVGHVTRQVRFATRIALPLSASDDLAVKITLDPANDRVDTFTYDAAGRQRFQRDAEGYVSETRYIDATGETQSIRYANRASGTLLADSLSTASFTPQAIATLGTAFRSTRSTDRAGRISLETDALGVSQRTTYDAAGRVKTITMAEGRAEQSITSYGYDAAGQRTSMTRATGTDMASTTRYTYDARGRLQSQIEARGVALAEGNGAWERAERVYLGFPEDLATLPPTVRTEAQAQLRTRYTTEYRYDAAGRLTQTIDPQGGTTSTAYDAFGNATVLTDARGYQRRQVFDQANRLLQSIDAERYLTAYGYDAFGNVTETLRVDARVQGSLGTAAVLVVASPPAGGAAYVLVNPALDAKTTSEYDKANRLLRKTEFASSTLSYTEGSAGALDAFGQRLSVLNKLGALASFSYDKLGRVLTETLPVTSTNAQGVVAKDANGIPHAVVNEYQYDSRGNRILSIEARGLAEQRTTQLRYDEANRLTYRIGMSYTAIDAAGTPSTVTPVDFFRYDAHGNTIEQIAHGQLQADGNSISGGSRSVAYYNALGLKQTEMSADRVLASFGYDPAGNQILQNTFATRVADAVVVNPLGAAPTVATTADDRTLRTRYDTLGRKTELQLERLYIWQPGTAINDISPPAVTLQIFYYDAVGNLVERKDGRGNSSYEYFDGIGRRLLSIDASGASVAWTYGRAGSVATQETRFAAQLPSGYTRQARKLADASPVDDPAALLARINGLARPAGARNRVTQVTLDLLGRVLEKRVLEVDQEYVDASGTKVSKNSSAISQYSYNGLGGLTQARDLAAVRNDGTEQWEVTDIVYDDLGRAIHRETPGYVDYEGATVRPTDDIQYDGLGNISRRIQRGKDNTSEADDRITRNEYDVNGLLVKTTDAAGAVTQYSIDAAGQVSRRTSVGVHRSDGSTRDLVKTYQHDAAGRVIVQKDLDTGELRKTRFNAFGEISAQGLGDGWEEFSEYSTLGKVIKTNAGDGAIKFYLYDANGNLTREIRGNGDSTVDLRPMNLRQAAESNKLYSRVNYYDARNLLVKTMDPQIETLRYTDTLGSLYTERYEAAWTPSMVEVKNSAPLPLVIVQATSGAEPTVSFSAEGSTNHLMSGELVPRVLGLTISADSSMTAPGVFTYKVASLKGLGRIRFQCSTWQQGAPLGSEAGVAYAQGYFEVDANGTVFLYPEEVRARSGSYIKWPVSPALVGTSMTEQLSYTIYYADGSLATTGVATGSGTYGPALDLSQYRNGSGTMSLRIEYTRALGREKATLNVQIDSAGQISASQDAALVANKVNLYVKGRDIKQAQLWVAGLGYETTGVYVPATATSFGYTRFSFDVRSDLPLGEWDFVMQAVNALDEFGNPIVQRGRILLDADYSHEPRVLNKVSALATSQNVVITRLQDFNAFGEVIEERDERVAERMLQAINYERALAKQPPLLLSQLTADQLAAARTSFSYNTLGKLVEKLDPETWVTAENGYRYRARPKTSYGYDLLGRHTTTLDANGRLSRVNQLAGARGDNEVAAFEFDARGGAADLFDAVKGATLQRKYDIFGDLRRVIDGEAGVTEQDYDKMGRLITVTRKNVLRYDGAGKALARIDLKDSYVYDELGQRIRFINALGNQGGPAPVPVGITTDYDGLGRVVKTVTNGGAETRYVYTQYEASQATILAMQGAKSPYSGGYRRETLRADGRKTTDWVEYFGHTVTHTDLSGAVSSYQYNSAGQLARQATGQRSANVEFSYYANGYIRSIADVTMGTRSDYTYDNTGNRISESYGTINTSVPKNNYGEYQLNSHLQNSSIIYDELNRIARVVDDRYNISYEYDAMGNRRMIDSLYKDQATGGKLDRQTYWYRYDELNRFTTSKGQLSTTQASTDNNRFANAKRGTGLGDTSVSIVAGEFGTELGYDKNSQRVSANYMFNGASVAEQYTYSSDGYLQLTKLNGVLRTSREIDVLGRTEVLHDLDSVTGSGIVVGQHTRSKYDFDNRLQSQSFVDDTKSDRDYLLSFSYYDAVAPASSQLARDAINATSSPNGKGALAKTVMHLVSAGIDVNRDTTTTYSYEYWDDAKQYQIVKSTPALGNGSTSIFYDVNGNLKYSQDSEAHVTNTFLTTSNGLVLTRTRTGPDQRTSNHYFYYVDAQRIGDVGDTPDEITRVSYAEQLALKDARRLDPAAKGRTYERSTGKSNGAAGGDGGSRYQGLQTDYAGADDYASTADFDQNYEPINDNYPGSAASAYTVRRDAETLASIAQALWGDAAMWYLIADANGLTNRATLKAGQLLVIPNKVTNIHNNAKTWRPYSPGEVMGNILPSLPTQVDGSDSTYENPANWVDGGDRSGDYAWIAAWTNYHDNLSSWASGGQGYLPQPVSPSNALYGTGLNAAMTAFANQEWLFAQKTVPNTPSLIPLHSSGFSLDVRGANAGPVWHSDEWKTARAREAARRAGKFTLPVMRLGENNNRSGPRLGNAIGSSIAEPSYKTLGDVGGTSIQRLTQPDLRTMDVPELNLGALPQLNLAPSAEELQADFRASERAYRQATDTGAVIQPGDTLERLTNGDKALMGRYASGMGLRSMNDLRVGQSMVANWDMSESDAVASANRFYTDDGRNKALLADAAVAREVQARLALATPEGIANSRAPIYGSQDWLNNASPTQRDAYIKARTEGPQLSAWDGVTRESPVESFNRKMDGGLDSLRAGQMQFQVAQSLPDAGALVTGDLAAARLMGMLGRAAAPAQSLLFGERSMLMSSLQSEMRAGLQTGLAVSTGLPAQMTTLTSTPTRLSFMPSSGVDLIATPGATTTILGNFGQDMKPILAELGSIKSLDFGARQGGFNVLNTPDALYLNPKQFWSNYNEPWLGNAVSRDDVFLMATEPSYGAGSRLFRLNDATGKLELSGFGREYLYLRQNSLVYDPITKQMVRK